MALGYVVAALISALLAVTELFTRYRGEPVFRILLNPYGLLYVGTNAAAGALVFLLLRLLNVGSIGTHSTWTLVGAVSAGLGAGLLMRSSLFVVSVDSRNTPVGPV